MVSERALDLVHLVSQRFVFLFYFEEVLDGVATIHHNLTLGFVVVLAELETLEVVAVSECACPAHLQLALQSLKCPVHLIHFRLLEVF